MDSPRTEAAIWPWVAATLVAQTAWGAYPVLARYLQTVSALPSMSIIAFGNLLALVMLTILLWRRIRWRAFRTPVLLLFGLIVVGRGVTNFLAARYTLAIYVQLITQMTPFIVALLSAVVLSERLPRYTGRAITLALLGAVLVMGGSVGVRSSGGTPYRTDWLGISLAAGSSVLLALYMIAVRRSSRYRIPAEVLLLTQLIALGSATTVISILAGEQWQVWLTLQPFDWLIFGGLVLGVFVSANILQIGAIRHLGAPLVSSTMAWRLVSALLVGTWLLGERLTSVWQFAGAALVLVTITWYLWQQR